MSSIRVLVADDHPIVRAGIRGVLSGETDLLLVGEVGHGAEIAAAVTNTSPDVLVLDLNMPGLPDPAALTSRLKQTHPHLKILVLSAHDEEELIVGLLEAGASGYALKDEMEQTLVHALRQVARGSSWFTQKVAEVLARRLVGADESLEAELRARDPSGPHAVLTPREVEILALIGSGASNPEIAAHLNISERTVRAHATHIYTKLALRGRTDAVLYAIRHGLVRP